MSFSISSIAKQATGAVSGFRKVLEVNPGSIPFVLPPQVQMGLAAAQALNSTLGTGLKVPSAKDLEQLASGQLDLILKGARRDVLSSLDKIQSQQLASLGKTPDEILNRIEWLL